MQKIQTHNQYILLNPSLLSADFDNENVFNIDFWREQNAVIGSAQGRGTTWFIQLPSTQAAIRHYHRGGLLGKLIHDHYIFTGWEKTRSIAEYHLLNHLADNGVHVPRPIAARAVKEGPTYRADIISEKVANARDLVDILQSSSLTDQQYIEIGKQIKKMHSQQVNHSDLNIHNILLDKHNKVWLIDFDKCYFQDGEAWKQSNIARLKRSFLKEQKKRSIHYQESHFTALLSGYQQA